MIIAVDFDGILCKNQFPAIGEPNYTITSKIQQLIDLGVEVILWTSRVDGELENAVAWCEKYGLYFCAINENAPSNIEMYKDKYPNGTRKVYADYYIDDHNLEFAYANTRGHSSLGRVECILTSIIERIKITEEEIKWTES